MKIIKRLSRNVFIFFAASLFSLVIVFLVKHPNLLQASVLNMTEYNLILSKNRDIAYKQDGNILEIFFSSFVKQFPVIIDLYHSEDISLDTTSVSGQCPFTILKTDQETTTISIQCTTFNDRESILIIPFTGATKDIIIGEAYYFTSSTEKQNFSVGNISSQKEHSL